MSLSLDLRLDDRQDDRVVVSVRVVPEGGSQSVDGIALELCSDEGERLGPRLLLPIAGPLTVPLVTRVELRCVGMIPPRSRVRATAWWGCEEIEASCPSDRGTSLECHMRGRTLVSLPNGKVRLARMPTGERERISRAMPWVDEPLVSSTEIEPLDTEETVAEFAEDVCAELGLDDDNAAWLKELLQADE